MYEFKYIPKDERFEGHIILTIPAVTQRYGYLEECGFQINDKGEIEASHKQLPAMVKMIEKVKEHIKEVALKRKDGSNEYKSYDDLAHDCECDAVLFELAGMLLNGFRPSKN